MPRPLRFVPENDTLVEITTRCFQSQYLLTPSPLVNEIILGVLARAANEHQVGVVAYCFMSSHYHLLVRVHDAEQLARFAGYLNSNVAREINRLPGAQGALLAGPLPLHRRQRRGGCPDRPLGIYPLEWL